MRNFIIKWNFITKKLIIKMPKFVNTIKAMNM